MYGYPTAWLVVVREVIHFCCSDENGNVVCKIKHRHLRAVNKCRHGTHIQARLKNGNLIKVTSFHSSASNGENAALPFPTTEEDYRACLEKV